MMTRTRMFGEDKPFMDWVRKHPELPSIGRGIGWAQTDVDTFVHRFMSPVDGISRRDIQPMMWVEVKTNGGMPSESQEDTLRKIHLTTQRDVNVETRQGRDGEIMKQKIRNYGVSILSMNGDRPDNSTEFVWYRFHPKKPHELVPKRITEKQLVGLLRFDLHPDNLQPNPMRRHHLPGPKNNRKDPDLPFP